MLVVRRCGWRRAMAGCWVLLIVAADNEAENPPLDIDPTVDVPLDSGSEGRRVEAPRSTTVRALLLDEQASVVSAYALVDSADSVVVGSVLDEAKPDWGVDVGV